MDKLRFDATDYSVVVKNRASLPNSWRWEIYRAGRASPIGQAPVFFHTMTSANKARKAALIKQLLAKLIIYVVLKFHGTDFGRLAAGVRLD